MVVMLNAIIMKYILNAEIALIVGCDSSEVRVGLCQTVWASESAIGSLTGRPAIPRGRRKPVKSKKQKDGISNYRRINVRPCAVVKYPHPKIRYIQTQHESLSLSVRLRHRASLIADRFRSLGLLFRKRNHDI